MSEKYDAVVVGAGPAGTTAAYILSKSGYRVLLIDKEKFSRKKICGGCLTVKAVKLLARVFGESEEELVRSNIINTRSNRFALRFKAEPLIDRPSAYTFYFVDRAIYDHALLQKAKEVGAEVAEGEKISAIKKVGTGHQPGKEKYRLLTAGGCEIDATYNVAADGANSTLRARLYRETNRSNRQWHRNMAYCIEITAEREGEFQALDHPILSFGYLRYGYAWLFPNKNKLVAGMGGLRRKNGNITNSFQQFLSDYSIRHNGNFKKSGHPLPYGNFNQNPTAGNIIFAGDAAGLVDPMLGEGIYQAHKSGELAARAILESLEKNADLTIGYTRSLQKHLYPEFIFARRWRRVLFNPVNHYLLKYSSARWVEAQFDRLVEVIHGARTYRWFKRTEIDRIE